MKIDIELTQLASILESGLLHPSEIQCLDNKTKDLLKTLCLQMCQPKNCQQCSLQNQCSHSLTMIPTSITQKPSATANC